MFYCPMASKGTTLQKSHVLIIAKPPPAPPVRRPGPTAQPTGGHDDCWRIRLSPSEMAKLCERPQVWDYEPDSVLPCQPIPSDRNLLDWIFGSWPSPMHDLILRGWLSPEGVRTGRWEICTLDNRVVAVVRYWAGVAMGHADLHDAGGFTVARFFLYDGVTVADSQLLNPILEPIPAGPGSLGIPRRYTTPDGFRWEGLMRDKQRVGPWLGFHANGEIAYVQHYHLDSGAAIGPWEYYDEHGYRTDVRQVLE